MTELTLMGQRYRHGLDTPDLAQVEPPRGTGAAWIVAVIAVLLLFALSAIGAGAKQPPKRELWIYGGKWCTHCREQDRDIKAGKLSGFTIEHLDAPPGVPVPCIAYWKADGKPGYFYGWGPGEEKAFIAQWMRDTKGKP